MISKRDLAILGLCVVVAAVVCVACRGGGGESTSGSGPSVVARIAAASPRVVELPAGAPASAEVVEATEIEPPRDALGPVVRVGSSQPRYFEQPVKIELPLFERPSTKLLSRMRAAYHTPHGWFSVAEPLELTDRGGPLAVVKSRHLGMSVLGGWQDGQWQVGAWCVRLLPEAGLEITDETKRAARILILVHGVWADPESWDGLTSRLVGRLPGDTAVIKMHCPPGSRLADSGRLFLSELNRLADANPKAEVHVVAHSTGGLVARYALEGRSRPKARVASLIMFGPPNRGSGWAAVARGDSDPSRVVLDDMVARKGASLRPLREPVAALVMFRDGAGAAISDLDPQSEFLSALNRDRRAAPADITYQVFVGRTQFTWNAVPDGTFFEQAGVGKRLGLVAEEIYGDWIVSEASAALSGQSSPMLGWPHFKLHNSAMAAEEVTRAVGVPIAGGRLTVLQGGTALAFSPDGSVIATANRDNTVRLWDAKTGKRLRALIGHTGSSLTISFTPNGECIVSGGKDNKIRIWKTATGELANTLEGPAEWVNSVSVSPNGTLIASAYMDQSILIWSASTGERVRALEGHTMPVLSIAFSPDGKIIASGSSDHSIRLWDASTGECLRLLKGHTSLVTSVAFSPDGKSLASGSSDESIRQWDVSTGDCLRKIEGGAGMVESVVFSPDGRAIAGGSWGGMVCLWNAASGSLLHKFKDDTGHVFSVAFSPDGKTIASGAADNTSETEHTVRLWRIGEEAPISLPLGHTGPILALDVSPDGRQLVTGAHDGTAQIWDTASRQHVRTLTSGTKPVSALAYSPDGEILALGIAESAISLWDTSTMTELRRLEGEVPYPYVLSFSPDGRTIVAGLGLAMWIWDVETGKFTGAAPHGGAVTSLAFSTDGNHIVSTSQDNSVRRWDVKQRAQLPSLGSDSKGSVHCVAYSPDGRSVAGGLLGAKSDVLIWDAESGTLRATLEGHSAAIRSIAYSPDGKTIASASDDGTIRLWDAVRGSLLRVLECRFSTVTFASDGSSLIGTTGTEVWIWSLTRLIPVPKVIR